MTIATSEYHLIVFNILINQTSAFIEQALTVPVLFLIHILLDHGTVNGRNEELYYIYCVEE